MSEQYPQHSHEHDDLAEKFSVDPLLRAEAGEGTEQGLNKGLLKLIVEREQLIEAMIEQGIHPPQELPDPEGMPEQGPILYGAYRSIVSNIESIKKHLGLPLSTEDN